jgi:hypothetical protein
MPTSKARQVKTALGGRAALEVVFIEYPEWAVDRDAIQTGVSWSGSVCHGKDAETGAVVAIDQSLPPQPRAVIEAEVARRLMEAAAESRRLRTRQLVAEIERLRQVHRDAGLDPSIHTEAARAAVATPKTAPETAPEQLTTNPADEPAQHPEER